MQCCASCKELICASVPGMRTTRSSATLPTNGPILAANSDGSSWRRPRLVLLTPRASKQLATLLFVSSVLGCTALIAQYSGGALGYEASLLAVVFPWVPLILTGSFIAVCAWAVLAAPYRHTSSVPFLAGTLSLTAIYYVILALPGIRYGAPYDRWDVWFYLGFGTDTQTTGHVNFLADFYPGLQTLTVGLYNIAAVPQEVTIAFLFPLIAALRIPVLALAGRRLLGNSGE